LDLHVKEVVDEAEDDVKERAVVLGLTAAASAELPRADRSIFNRSKSIKTILK